MVRGAAWRVGRVEVAEVAPGQRCGDDDLQRGQDPVEGSMLNPGPAPEVAGGASAGADVVQGCRDRYS